MKKFKRKKYWLLGLIILLEWWRRFCSNHLNLNLLSLVLSALMIPLIVEGAPFQFSIGDLVHVTADKGYRYGNLNKYEVVGNVVIIHGGETLYGEAGTLNIDTGQIDVKGNVRYIGPDMTLYGSQLDFNIKTGLLFVQHARIINKDYTVQGETMVRSSPGEIVADDAEYSTCRDCPESWSIFGKKVRIVLGQYIYIINALIKANGASIMYLPYMVLPIKRERQTGLLFPQFILSFKEGFHYKQPWFWAIGPHNDMTLAPWSRGVRGVGNELEYRHIFGESRWFEVHSLQAFDRIYAPNKGEDNTLTGHHAFRQMTDYEHHYQLGNFLTHHFYHQNASDLDILADYPTYANNRMNSSELGTGTFLDAKTSLFSYDIQAYFNRTLFYPDSKMFDHQYVQILPRISLDMTPVTLIHTPYPFLQNISFGGNSTFTNFRQNHVLEETYIRNARRFTANPFLNFSLGYLGPLEFQTNLLWDFQYYHFPYEREHYFRKKGTIIVSETSFEIGKFFGLAYKEKLPFNRLELEGDEQKKWLKERKEVQNKKDALDEDLTSDHLPEDQLIGNLPSYDENYSEDTIDIYKIGYKHSVLFNLRHHYTADQTFIGNERFQKQIESEPGLFDYQDAPRKLRHEIGSLNTKTDISQRNTLELRIFNSLFRKSPKNYSHQIISPYLRDNFDYGRLAFINLSQGLELDSGEDRFTDKLTRLYTTAGFPLLNWNITTEDYYFYKYHRHKFITTISRTLWPFNLSLRWTYESMSQPPEKSIDMTIGVRPNERFELTFKHARDLRRNKAHFYQYGILYSPWNNCWKLDLGYLTTDEDKQITFNFWLNFGESKFTSILNPMGEPGV